MVMGGSGALVGSWCQLDPANREGHMHCRPTHGISLGGTVDGRTRSRVGPPSSSTARADQRGGNHAHRAANAHELPFYFANPFTTAARARTFAPSVALAASRSSCVASAFNVVLRFATGALSAVPRAARTAVTRSAARPFERSS